MVTLRKQHVHSDDFVLCAALILTHVHVLLSPTAALIKAGQVQRYKLNAEREKWGYFCIVLSRKQGLSYSGPEIFRGLCVETNTGQGCKGNTLLYKSK